MKQFKDFLAEGYTLSLDKWKEKFGADFLDDVISVLDSIQPLVTTFNFEEKIKGKVKPIIQGKISGLEIDDLMLKISVYLTFQVVWIRMPVIICQQQPLI